MATRFAVRVATRLSSPKHNALPPLLMIYRKILAWNLGFMQPIFRSVDATQENIYQYLE